MQSKNRRIGRRITLAQADQHHSQVYRLVLFDVLMRLSLVSRRRSNSLPWTPQQLL